MVGLVGALFLSIGLGSVPAPPPGIPTIPTPTPAPAFSLAAVPPDAFAHSSTDPHLAGPYFGARYYSAPIARFTTVDPAYTIQENLVDPQRWNRYAYARNNPLRYVDPDGRCIAPAGVGGGVGFCVEAFISSPGIGPFGDVGGPGFGDNRTFSATEDLSFRARVQFVVDTTTGQVSGFNQEAGTSSVGLPGLGLEGPGRRGSIHANITNQRRTDEGDTTFTLNILAQNGLAALPTAPKDPIDINLNFVVTREGKVGLAPGGTQTGYPSVGAYAYTNGGKSAKTVYERQEGKPSDLSAPKIRIPERRPE
jgi:RHS repeat-associated protein